MQNQGLICNLLLVLYVTPSSPLGTPRIINGKSVNIRDFPFIVSIQNLHHEHWCGGSIISKSAVLTAAHCIFRYEKAPYFLINAGSTNVHAGKIRYTIAKIRVHPEYDSESDHFDFAILFLKYTFEFNADISIVPIATSNYVIPDNATVTILGWGLVDDAHASDVLKAAEIFTVNKYLCQSAYKEDVITDSMICAGISDGVVRDACLGDSGGPLVHRGVLVGVISWGDSCADPEHPGIYARVSAAYNWIAAHVHDLPAASRS